MKELTEEDFVALGRTLLRGEALSNDLMKILVEKTLSHQLTLRHATDSEGNSLFVHLIFPLGLIYKTLYDVTQNRISIESDIGQSVQQLGQVLMQSIFLQIAHSVTFP